MTTWNYRLIRRTITDTLGNPHTTYSIHEAYYNDEGEIWGLTENAVSLDTEHLNDLKMTWSRLVEAFGQPILDYDEVISNTAKPPFSLDETEMEEAAMLEVTEDVRIWDAEEYEKEEQIQREQDELQHNSEFIGRSPQEIQALIETLRAQSP